MDKLSEIFSLRGKNIVITGATGLLGKKHAEIVACYGGTPVLLDLSQEKINNYVNELNDKYQVDADGFAIDITNERMIKDNAKHLISRFGKIDGLVNNAANNPKVESSNEDNFSRLENFPIDSWHDDIAVGLTGAFLCAKHYGYLISQNPEGGSIVNISSDLGLIAPDQRLYSNSELPDHQKPVKPVSYSVVKTGVIGLTRYISSYWSDKNVRCNAICPGGIENGQPVEFLTEISKRIPLGRMAYSHEIQGILVWMLSDAASYLNGAIVPLDGGRSAW